MTQAQRETYFGALAIRIGSNALRFVRSGEAETAYELARNAAHMAFCAFPSLRLSN